MSATCSHRFDPRSRFGNRRRRRLAAAAVGAAVAAVGSTAAPAHASRLGIFEGFGGAGVAWPVSQQFSAGAATVVPDGGRRGAGDAWLRKESNGIAGSTSRMSIPANLRDFPDWGGDYARGIDLLRVDVQNPGDTPLHLRLGVSGTVATYVSATPIVVPAGRDWVRLRFPITERAMINLTGNEADWPLSRVLDRVEGLRLVSSVGLPLLGRTNQPQGDTIEAVIGIDNLTLIPEPAAAGLAAIGASAAARRRRRRRV